jgi:hypothetical protein
VNKLLYLNGTVPHAGTLYIRYMRSTTDFTTNSDPIWVFPTWSHMLLALFTVGIHKGGVDYDDINARMAPDNRALAELTVKQSENWDNELQLIEQEGYEPYERSDGWRPDHVNL